MIGTGFFFCGCGAMVHQLVPKVTAAVALQVETVRANAKIMHQKQKRKRKLHSEFGFMCAHVLLERVCGQCISLWLPVCLGSLGKKE